MISNFSLKQHFQFSLWSELFPHRAGWSAAASSVSALLWLSRLRLSGVEALWNSARLLHQRSLWRVNRRWLPAEVKNKPSTILSLHSSPLSSTSPPAAVFLHTLSISLHSPLQISIHCLQFCYSISLISSPSFFFYCIVSSSDLQRLCFHIFSLLFFLTFISHPFPFLQFL